MIQTPKDNIDEAAEAYADDNSSFKDCPTCNGKHEGQKQGFKAGAAWREANPREWNHAIRLHNDIIVIISELMVTNPKPETEMGKLLLKLAGAVDKYEKKQWPLDEPKETKDTP